MVSETVERASKTIQRSTEGEKRIGEGRAHQFACVCGDITTFVITT